MASGKPDRKPVHFVVLARRSDNQLTMNLNRP
jgi:hypothetical protein